MRRSNNASNGSFRTRDLDVLAPDCSGRWRTWDSVQIASRDGPPIDPRRDPAYHNRMLFAAANR